MFLLTYLLAVVDRAGGMTLVPLGRRDTWRNHSKLFRAVPAKINDKRYRHRRASRCLRRRASNAGRPGHSTCWSPGTGL